jgi:hypothetical protein
MEACFSLSEGAVMGSITWSSFSAIGLSLFVLFSVSLASSAQASSGLKMASIAVKINEINFNISIRGY